MSKMLTRTVKNTKITVMQTDGKTLAYSYEGTNAPSRKKVFSELATSDNFGKINFSSYKCEEIKSKLSVDMDKIIKLEKSINACNDDELTAFIVMVEKRVKKELEEMKKDEAKKNEDSKEVAK